MSRIEKDLMSDPEELAFAAEFPAATREQWLKLVDGVLKGAPFDKRLIAKTYDGLTIQPLYPGDPAAHPVAARAPGAAWTVMQRVDHPDPAAANEQALHDLENGATGLTLVHKGSVNANGYGLDASRETLERVLATWPAGQQPKIHYSSPRTEMREQERVDKKTRKKTVRRVAPVFTGHADFCNPFEFATFMREAEGLDFDVMLEAKAKDLALLRLRPDLLRYAPDVAARFGLASDDAQRLELEEAAVLDEEQVAGGA